MLWDLSKETQETGGEACPDSELVDRDTFHFLHRHPHTHSANISVTDLVLDTACVNAFIYILIDFLCLLPHASQHYLDLLIIIK